jgi:hypothetical protein
MWMRAMANAGGWTLVLMGLLGCSKDPTIEAESVTTMTNARLPNITKEMVQNLEHEDLYGGEMALYTYCIKSWSNEKAEGYLEKQIAMLNKVPQRLGYYYLIHSMVGSWGNGGMQAVALEYDPQLNAEILRRRAEAYRFYGDTETASLIDKLIPVALAATKALDEAEKRNATDSDLEKIWATIDDFDTPFDQASGRFDIYEAMLKDMHRNPRLYVP